jgi:hypothetical protein
MKFIIKIPEYKPDHLWLNWEEELDGSPHYLKLLHHFLHAWSKVIAPMNTVFPDGAHEKISPGDGSTLRCTVCSRDESGFLFVNNLQQHTDTQDQRDIHFEIQVKGGTLGIPFEGSLLVKKNTWFMLPFNLDMQGTLLKTATVQPLTVLQQSDFIHYFFFAPEGIAAEYVFESTSLNGISSDVKELARIKNHTLVRVEPGVRYSFNFKSASGKQVRITTLTQSEAECSWRGMAWGTERLILANANLIFIDDAAFPEGGVQLYLEGVTRADLTVFPGISGSLTCSGGAIKMTSGDFSRLKINVTEQLAGEEGLGSQSTPAASKTICRIVAVPSQA